MFTLISDFVSPKARLNCGLIRNQKSKIRNYKLKFENLNIVKMEPTELIDAFSEFKELKNIDRASMMSILEDVFRGMIKKKYGSSDNFDIVINTDKGDLEAFRTRLIMADSEVTDTNTQVPYSEAVKIE